MPAALDSGLGDSLGSVIFGTGSGGVGLGGGILGTGSSGVGLGSGPQGSGAGAQGGTAAVVLTVQNLNDKGAGSLRQAILDADSTGGSGQDTITFTPGLTGSINLRSALPDLQGTIDLEGPGAGQVTVQRSAAPHFGIFNVPGGATVTVAGLTIANGKASSGGGISNAGSLTVTDCVLSKNTADFGAGGGIFNNGGTVTLVRSVVRDSGGTGVYSSGGEVAVTDSTISGSAGTGFGGGVSNGGTMTITNSTISGNTAAFGGGIFDSGTLTVASCTVSGNTALGNSISPGTGGGISTGPLSGVGVTILDSIIARNTGSGRPDVDGTVTSLGHNLIGDGTGSSGFAAAAGDQVGTPANPVDPRLGPLQDNGGPTPTMALLAGSPAIDAADPNNFPATDQRGVARPQHGGGNGSALPDMGAYEANLFASTPTLAAASDSGIPGDNITNVNRPTFTGTAGTGTTVTLLAGSTVLGSAVADNVTGAWSITSSTLGDGAHSITASAKDAAGHTGVPSTALRVMIDTQAPTSTIAFPGSGTYDASSWTGSLSGGSSDATSGVQAVQISVRQGSTGLFWRGDGTGFSSSTEVFRTAVGTTSWSLAFPGSNFPSGGSYTVHAQATDVAGNVEAGSTVSFAVLGPVQATGVAVRGTEGAAFMGQAVATFTDPANGNPGGTAYTATIDWGDGAAGIPDVTPGTVSGADANGVFTVRGNHTYAEEGSYTVTTTVHKPKAFGATATSTGTVFDPAVQATGTAVSATEGSAFTGGAVATFTDRGSAGPNAGDPTGTPYTATIDWGDGTPGHPDVTPGTISGPDGSGVFTVRGNHTYTEEGSYTVTTTIHHENAPDATATSTAMVFDPAVRATGTAVSATEGSAFTGLVVATFTDPAGVDPDAANAAGTAYKATIDWGDGSAVTTGEIAQSGNLFTVRGSHTYAAAAHYTVTTTIDHEGAPPQVVTSTADVTSTTPVISDVTSQVNFTPRRIRFNPMTRRSRVRLHIRNRSDSAIQGPLFLVLDKLPHKVRLRGPDGFAQTHLIAGSPYRVVPIGGNGLLTPGQDVTVVLEFLNPLRRRITFTPRVLAGAGLP
jgi:hypothetical protein